MRVSFISGDVHLAAAGRLYSFPKTKSLASDPGYMPQFVSSAIVNAPPPDLLVKGRLFDMSTEHPVVCQSDLTCVVQTTPSTTYPTLSYPIINLQSSH
jgi:hypothetical protein